ncbi:c-type cytochrome [Chryseobacterium carnipullorum]|nr:heme-binding domain-containing protein [Chryseobacterium carnipullorum]MDN5396675.1 heme-binding domain-containing protein [Chryseobacterium sp.]MDN5422843.1 heme-binding domain-containing protein [Chryseobacterium sp.]MDN5478479.1 heme-binding domain-containing protein [Chryseobacterium sp.]STC92251.1 Uncharacterised protein [Chryseobacterium carnipullorum]
MKKILYILSSAALFTACDSRTYDEISDNTPITAPVRYNAEVKAIVDNSCINCHSAGSFKPLATYTDVKNNIDGIIDRIQRPNGDPGKMPQGGSLSQTQINTFIKWKADGLTEN